MLDVKLDKVDKKRIENSINVDKKRSNTNNFDLGMLLPD